MAEKRVLEEQRERQREREEEEREIKNRLREEMKKTDARFAVDQDAGR